MKCQFNVILSVVTCFLCLQDASSEPPKANHHPRPLVFKSWPPNRQSASIRNNGMTVHLRGSGSANIPARLPAPGMFIKSAAPFRFAVPSRPMRGPLLGSHSSYVYFNAGPSPQAAALKRPYTAHTTSPGVFKFSTQAQKTAIKFQSPPSVPLNTKPEFIYEKVNVPKHPDPVRYNIGSDGAIHTIPAPNLSLNDGTPIPEITGNNLNNIFDSDLATFSTHGFALEKPTHQYQVQEANNDQTFRNSFTGQTNYYAPDNDPSLRTQSLRPVDDPLSVPSNGKPKPVDVQFHQNLDNYGASALVQEPQYSIDPFGFPVTSQPQLQQYHLQQNTMLRQGMPLASLNPTYLVVQSNNLLNQHQQHLTPNLFRPENGFVDTSVTSQPSFVTSQPSFVTYNSYDYSGPQEVASLGQILSAQRDALEQQYEVSSTQAPSTISNYAHHDGQASQNNPTYSQVPDPKPSNYQYSQQNFVDLPDERLTQHDIQNLLNYNGLYQDYINHRQLENDLILREAQEKLQNKLSIQHQQQQTAYDLHQLVQQEKYNPLRIVVPDEDQEQFKRRSGIDESSYDDDEEADDDSDENDSSSKTETEGKKLEVPEK